MQMLGVTDYRILLVGILAIDLLKSKQHKSKYLGAMQKKNHNILVVVELDPRHIGAHGS